jgi:hypothetical protein
MGYGCLTTITNGVTTGACASLSICKNTTTTTCTTLDYANKRGPICFFGQFGNSNRPQACAIGQLCQVREYKFCIYIEYF